MNSNPNIISFKSEEFLDHSTIFLKDLIIELQGNNLPISIALSGGSSPLPIYEKLKEHDINWKLIKFFIVDERCVSINDEKSNYGNINQCFFKFIASKSFSIIDDKLGYKESAAKYQELILEHVKSTNNLPQFDLIILGMGLDGHTASLFPKTKALKNDTDLVVINEVPQLTTTRITMTYPLILNAKKIILIAKGNKKKELLDEVFELKSQYPISKIIPQIDMILN